MKTYSIVIPVRCDECDELETKVETELSAENLPPCPNCGAPHFGGGGETEITPEVDEEEREMEKKRKSVTGGQSDSDQEPGFEDGYKLARNEILEIARQLAESGFNPSTAFDYLLIGELDVSAEEWAKTRDVSANTVNYNVNQATEFIEENDEQD